jgi:hypothetical protein
MLPLRLPRPPLEGAVLLVATPRSDRFTLQGWTLRHARYVTSAGGGDRWVGAASGLMKKSTRRLIGQQTCTVQN